MAKDLFTVLQISLLDESGDSYHRMRWPGRQLAAQEPRWRVINLDFRAQERRAWALAADLLVVLHCGDVEILPIIQERRSCGKKTLIEINDNFYSPQPWNPARSRWDHPVVWKTYEKFIESADGVIVTGQGLRELFEERAGGKIHLLENHLPFELGEFASVWKEPAGQFNLGWAGSAGHMADLLSVVPELQELLAEFPQLRLHIMGDESTPQFVDLPDTRFTFVPFGPMKNYFEFWNSVHLGFVPLLDSPYNRCRSDIKAVEMAGRGVLPIIQEALPYRPFCEACEPPTFRTPREFKERVRNYIRSPDRLRADAERAFRYVRASRLGSMRKERYELYQRMMPKSAEANFAWPVGAGFHEISGTIENAPRPDAGAAISIRDELRLKLSELSSARNIEERVSVWQKIFSEVQMLKDTHRDRYQKDVVRYLLQDFNSLPGGLELAESFVEFFQNSVELRYALAQGFERMGNLQKARLHFSWLVERRREFEENKEVFDQLPDYFCKVWPAALARTTG